MESAEAVQEATNSPTDLDYQKHSLDVEKLKFEREKLQQESVTKIGDLRNNTIDRLTTLIKYLNDVQDNKTTTLDEGHQSTVMTKEGRELNPLEEEVMNGSLQVLRKILFDMAK